MVLKIVFVKILLNLKANNQSQLIYTLNYVKIF